MSTSNTREHRRVYQACEPCREKKVRCELGSADCPNKPPCSRCRRESKQCFFAASRIRKTTSTKRKAQSPLPQESNRSQPSTYVSSSTLLPRNPTPVVQEESQTFRGDGRAAAALLEGQPRTYHDALTLLSEAYEHTEARNGLTNHPPGLRTKPIGSSLGTHTDTSTNKGANEALCAWSKLRFVRGGLFTAEEALDMVDHFYNFQSAFSPVVPECFRDHSQHSTMIEEEPILTIAILMIGSRYRKWTGPAAVARSYIVHDRLWRYLQGMISRLFWSEDLFVGEFPSLKDSVCGSGKGPRAAYTDSWSHGFRTLGTCEALLLLLDWHPRALHFPPPDEDTSSIVVQEPKKPRKSASTGYYGPGSGHDWLARSDRLCQSMLSTVLMLATEMGIFCDDNSFWQGDEVRHDPSKVVRDQERFYRIRCLIWVYATQHPGRPGRRNPMQCAPTKIPGVKNDDATECWMRVATIMKNANDLLFVSPRYTADIIRNGQYLQIVGGLEPLLNESIIEFDHAKLARQTRYILTIEYEYAQLCILSVVLQAVINRNCRDSTSGRLESCSEGTSTEEEKHLRGTVSAARAILRTALDDLLPHGSLRYIPVRSYSRLLGATLILLKCCAAGISEIDIPMSLDLVRRVAVGLRNSSVDDTHLSTRWGDLLENLVHRLQSRLAQPTTPKACNVRIPLATPIKTHVDASQVSHEAQPSITQHSSQDAQAGTDLEQPDLLDFNRSSAGEAKQDTQFDAWSMWWDNQFSQVNLNYMPWYPTLGLLDGSDPTFSNGADSIFESAGSTHPSI
ncbi:Pc20g09600 [Penicillium rubens Wisconsin 54-1255]|uniref:Pc20g09600 protein n=1 Tax=Penicillium rubens (strain ATCC 28089 / DSM 1075 / NRRL 1951 / Wisconsin 54-1255) TaxID=500485 RepID=B6HFB8_PENRW|nr:Pc20g09600 [Penicillium rubens Wisconsin 54-1255]